MVPLMCSPDDAHEGINESRMTLDNNQEWVNEEKTQYNKQVILKKKKENGMNGDLNP